MTLYRNTLNLFVCLVLTSTIGFSQASHSAAPDIEVPDGKAVIYFFRPDGFSGSAIKFHVHDMAGNPMGYLGKGGDNFSIVVDPGTHEYWSRAASRNDISMTVEVGNTYYVKGTVNMGFVVGRPVLEQVTAADVP